MMNEDEVRYEWTQAVECLNAAKYLIDGGYLNSALNRLYYAVYHAAKTLFLRILRRNLTRASFPSSRCTT